MQISKIKGICFIGLAIALAHAPPAAAFYGCFCSQQNEEDRICGEVLKFDRDTTIVIKPTAKAKRTLEPIEFAECREQTPESPRCPTGQTLRNGICVAVAPTPPAVPPPAIE